MDPRRSPQRIKQMRISVEKGCVCPGLQLVGHHDVRLPATNTALKTPAADAKDECLGAWTDSPTNRKPWETVDRGQQISNRSKDYQRTAFRERARRKNVECLLAKAPRSMPPVCFAARIRSTSVPENSACKIRSSLGRHQPISLLLAKNWDFKLR